MKNLKNVKYLNACCGVRYWEDATVNGVEDKDGTLIPCKENIMWCPLIDIEKGQIIEWPIGTVASIHYKVCDDGSYTLFDKDMNIVAVRNNDYVPGIMCPGGDGFGDYVIMEIDENGFIADWEVDFEGFRFIEETLTLKLEGSLVHPGSISPEKNIEIEIDDTIPPFCPKGEGGMKVVLEENGTNKDDIINEILKPDTYKIYGFDREGVRQENHLTFEEVVIGCLREILSGFDGLYQAHWPSHFNPNAEISSKNARILLDCLLTGKDMEQAGIIIDTEWGGNYCPPAKPERIQSISDETYKCDKCKFQFEIESIEIDEEPDYGKTNYYFSVMGKCHCGKHRKTLTAYELQCLVNENLLKIYE